MAQITYRSGTSFARGTSMDALLNEQDTQVLYERWNSQWGEPIGLHGGEVLVTAEMVSVVPLEQMVSVFGKTRAARLMEIAKKYASL